MNLERLKDLDFNKEVFILEDLDFNVRASRAGHVLCRCYRYQQMKVNGMRKGGCADGVEESGGWGGGGDEPPAPAPAPPPAPEPAPSDLQSFIKQVVHVSHKRAIAKTSDASGFVDEVVSRICRVLDTDEFEVECLSRLRQFVQTTSQSLVPHPWSQLVGALGREEKPHGRGDLGANKATEFVRALIEAVDVSGC
jgi:hypothetical protein